MNPSQSTSCGQDRPGLDIVDFGIYVASLAPVADEAMATGFHNDVHFPSLVRRTDIVPLRLGLVFGVASILRGIGGGQYRLRTVWRYPLPGIRNERSGQMQQTSEMTETFTTGERCVKTYSFDRPAELLAGRWTLEFWLDERKLNEKSFLAKAGS